MFHLKLTLNTHPAEARKVFANEFRNEERLPFCSGRPATLSLVDRSLSTDCAGVDFGLVSTS